MLEGLNLWHVASAALLLWLPQNAAHEGAHALAHRHWGDEITRFIVYPSNASGQFSLAFWARGFTWAYMMAKSAGKADKTARGVQYIAPQFANTVVCSVLLALHWRFPGLPQGLVTVLAAWYLVNFIDGAVNLGTFYRPFKPMRTTDGWGFQRYWDVPVWACRLGAVAWHLWFGFHLFVPGSWGGAS